MSDIDRKRVAAVKFLEEGGYQFREGRWVYIEADAHPSINIGRDIKNLLGWCIEYVRKTRGFYYDNPADESSRAKIWAEESWFEKISRDIIEIYEREKHRF